MKRFLVLIAVLLTVVGVAADTTTHWSAWPYRLKLHLATPELSDFTRMAEISVNLGPRAAEDCADVRILDTKGREHPWRLRSRSPSGDAKIVFRTVPGIHDYTLIFGNPAAPRPSYREKWNIGRVIIDDFLPKRAYIHGLWSWVKAPVISGVYAHGNPITDRFNYHGTSEIRNVPLYQSTELNQYVLLDKDDPPGQIVLRLVFEKRQGAPVWDPKSHLNLYWGKRNIKGELSGPRATTIRMGKLPQIGVWQKLTVNMGDLLRKTNFRWPDGGLPDLFGVEFCTDRGRATWDMTTVAEVPGQVVVVGLERTSTSVKPTFVTQRLHAFKLGDSGRTLTVLRLFPTAGEKTRCEWSFGDGTPSKVRHPVHVFEGTGPVSVSLVTTEPDGEKVDAATVELKGLGTGADSADFAIELVSCPFIVRAERKALFNLRLEGSHKQGVQVETHAVLLDAGDKEIRRERELVTMLPGKKHPTFKAFSLDVSDGDIRRVRFEMRLRGRELARREVTLFSSRSVLSDLHLAGDRYLDKFGKPAVIRCGGGEVAAEPPERTRTGLPANVLVIGSVPTGSVPFEEHLKKGIESSARMKREVVVTATGVKPLPAWSMPYRQAVAMSAKKIDANTEVVIVASATEMMLGGVPAATGADAIAVCMDQIRRQSKAEVFLLTPTIYSGLEGLARQYTVALRMLGIEKGATVIDVYSPSVRMGDEDAELLKTAKVTDGVLVQELHPRRVRGITSAVIEALLSTPTILSSSE